MKTKKFKRVLTLVLALAMMLSLSMVAFADGDPDGSINVIVRFATYDTATHQYSYSAEAPITVDFFTGDTVYDAVDRAFGTDADWYETNETPSRHYLEGITINNALYADERIEAAASCYNEDDEYENGNAIIDSLNELDDFIDCDGVYMSMAMLMEDESYEGYYIMGDMQHMCAITKDWVFEVNYADDNPDAGFVYPPNGTSLDTLDYLYTMEECVLHDGDTVQLTYGLIWVIFE